MTYAVQQDLVDRFGSTELEQLTDRENATVIDAVVLSRALSDADAEIDGYLAARYSLPLASVPPMLARIAADIARYRLFRDGGPEAVRKHYEDAVRDLKAISSGTILIDGATPLATSASTAAVKVKSPDRVFCPDCLRGY